MIRFHWPLLTLIINLSSLQSYIPDPAKPRQAYTDILGLDRIDAGKSRFTAIQASLMFGITNIEDTVIRNRIRKVLYGMGSVHNEHSNTLEPMFVITT